MTLHSTELDSGLAANTGSSVTAAVQNNSAWKAAVNDVMNAWMKCKPDNVEYNTSSCEEWEKQTCESHYKVAKHGYRLMWHTLTYIICSTPRDRLQPCCEKLKTETGANFSSIVLKLILVRLSLFFHYSIFYDFPQEENTAHIICWPILYLLTLIWEDFCFLYEILLKLK